MNPLARFLRATFYWTYSRGSWQWDIYCLAIIAVIFLTPKDFLESYTRIPLVPDQIRSAVAKFFGFF